MRSSRRQFLKNAASGWTAGCAFSRGPAIQKITLLDVPGEFFRTVAMNAYDSAPKGKVGSEKLIRVFLSDGTIGLGVAGYHAPGEAFLKQMIGAGPLEMYAWDGDQIGGVRDERLIAPANACFESAVLDAVGKLKQKPTYRLFGASVRDGVDCYDGSLYFVDVAARKGAEAVGQVAAQIKADGSRAIKLKTGRPFKWMKGEAGVSRDIEVFIAAREAVGVNFNLMADANNGYDGHFDWAVRFLTACAPYEMYWIEEIFPETVESYRRLGRALLEAGAAVPFADGESIQNMDEFRPYLEARLWRYIQPDMRTCGFSNILRAAAMAQPHQANLVAHNWNSEFGRLMCLHAAKLRRNIPLVEDDRFHSFALDASAYAFREGQWFVPERPGWGIELSPAYERFRRSGEEMVIQ